MPSGYTFDSNHGPGAYSGSSGSSSGSFKSNISNAMNNVASSVFGSGRSGNAVSNIREYVDSLAQSISNAVSTNTSALGDKIRELMQNPSTSAYQANVYDTYLMDYGLGFDMDEYYDNLLDLAHYNNNWSAQQANLNRQWQHNEAQRAMEFESSMANKAMNFEAQQAQKQMDYQTRSDKAAMAWSAQEAAKSRDWTKMMSDTAHRREVKDLLAAGLNPILAANGGAWAGSGASGSGFSSSGAMGSGFSASGHTGSGSMGQTDMSVNGAFSSMVSGMMTTARDLAITKMQTDQAKYATDQQYAMAKMAAETSIYNNNSNIDANKAIRALDRDADIRRAGISADATRAAAATSAGAVTSAAATQAAAARYSADRHLEASKYSSENSLEGTKYSSDKGYEGTQYRTDRDIKSNPVGYGLTMGAETTQKLAKAFSNIENVYAPDFSNLNLLGAD